jgi:hypothetical protein
MKTLLGLLLVTLLFSSALAQQTQEDIKQAIENYYHSKQEWEQPLTWKITQVEQGSASQELIDKYDAKQTYCLHCKKTIRFGRLKCRAHYSGPDPLKCEWVPPVQTNTLLERHVVIITRSGGLKVIKLYTMPRVPARVPKDDNPPPLRMPSYMPPPPVLDESGFQSLWQETCPFPTEQ